MKLVLYSGGNGRLNRNLVLEARAMFAAAKDPVVAFIPADSEDFETDFLQFKRKFSYGGIRNFRCFPLDKKLSEKSLASLFACDAIFLGGGNTYEFLRNLRQNRLETRLRAYVRRGGILMGLSAGSILLTPNIRTASVPSLEADDNEVGLRNFSALDLVPFEFSPHYLPIRSVDKELLAHSKKISHPVYACEDGNGIVINGSNLKFVGRVFMFHRGKKSLIQ